MQKKTLLTIITESIIEPMLLKDLMRLGAHGYTITDARGAGVRGTRDAEYDQNRNVRIESICEETVARSIAKHLLDTYGPNYGLVVFLSDVEVFRPEKF